MHLVLISGLSGSGKSVALRVLEDASFYCVDNLPASLLQDVMAHLKGADQKKVAISIDARSGNLSALPQQILELQESGNRVQVLFLDAKTETLIKRFSETRRRHPLADGTRTVAECIELERDLLEPLDTMAHHIDTSDLRPNTLRDWIKQIVEIDRDGMVLQFESFGFKKGIPLDADLVFDVRVLPNPHYDPQLRPLTGLDKPVADFLAAEPRLIKMVTDIRNFIDAWLQDFIEDNRSSLTVAIGCTGGQHRSVYIAEQLGAYFKDRVKVLVRHRELG